jgi:hypothetical protein
MKKYKMKNHTIFNAFIVLILLASCSPKIYAPGIVSYIKSEGNEVIILKADEYGKTKDLATLSAEKNAIKQLIFEGVSGSPINDPMSPDGRKLMEQHPDYFNQLFEKNGFRKFVTCSELISSEIVDRKTYHNTVKVCIAYRNLRLDMEKNGVIKKFGF